MASRRPVPYTEPIWYQPIPICTLYRYPLPLCGNRTLSTCVLYRYLCNVLNVPDVFVVVVNELSHGVHRVDVFYKKEDLPYEKE